LLCSLASENPRFANSALVLFLELGPGGCYSNMKCHLKADKALERVSSLAFDTDKGAKLLRCCPLRCCSIDRDTVVLEKSIELQYVYMYVCGCCIDESTILTNPCGRGKDANCYLFSRISHAHCLGLAFSLQQGTQF
jgi:hypothetical protein